jgi:hypothetical protein
LQGLNFITNSRDSMKRILVSSLAVAGICGSAPAASLALNFTDGWGTPCVSGETADGFNGWTDSRAPNDWTDPSKGTVTLVGSAVTATWNAANTWAAGQENTSEQQIYRVYLDDGDGGNSLVGGDGIGVSVTISGLATWMTANGYLSYAVRAYSSTDTDNALFRTVSVRAGAPNSADGVNQLTNLAVVATIPVTVRGPGDFAPNTTPDPTWGMWQPRGYGDSGTPLTNDVITLTVPTRDGNNRGTLAAFRIEGVVPEPATSLLFGSALLGSLLRRRRA